jgi:hypothetical protein
MDSLSCQFLAGKLGKTESCAQPCLPQGPGDNLDAREAPAWPLRT